MLSAFVLAVLVASPASPSPTLMPSQDYVAQLRVDEALRLEKAREDVSLAGPLIEAGVGGGLLHLGLAFMAASPSNLGVSQGLILAGGVVGVTGLLWLSATLIERRMLAAHVAELRAG